MEKDSESEYVDYSHPMIQALMKAVGEFSRQAENNESQGGKRARNRKTFIREKCYKCPCCPAYFLVSKDCVEHFMAQGPSWHAESHKEYWRTGSIEINLRRKPENASEQSQEDNASDSSSTMPNTSESSERSSQSSHERKKSPKSVPGNFKRPDQNVSKGQRKRLCLEASTDQETDQKKKMLLSSNIEPIDRQMRPSAQLLELRRRTLARRKMTPSQIDAAKADVQLLLKVVSAMENDEKGVLTAARAPQKSWTSHHFPAYSFHNSQFESNAPQSSLRTPQTSVLVSVNSVDNCYAVTDSFSNNSNFIATNTLPRSLPSTTLIPLSNGGHLYSTGTAAPVTLLATNTAFLSTASNFGIFADETATISVDKNGDYIDTDNNASAYARLDAEVPRPIVDINLSCLNDGDCDVATSLAPAQKHSEGTSR